MRLFTCKDRGNDAVVVQVVYASSLVRSRCATTRQVCPGARPISRASLFQWRFHVLRPRPRSREARPAWAGRGESTTACGSGAGSNERLRNIAVIVTTSTAKAAHAAQTRRCDLSLRISPTESSPSGARAALYRISSQGERRAAEPTAILIGRRGTDYSGGRTPSSASKRESRRYRRPGRASSYPP